MSDNETPTKQNSNKRIHYGSLEDTVNLNRKVEPETKKATQPTLSYEDLKNDVNYDYGPRTQASLKQRSVIQELERTKRAKNLVLPTQDTKVRKLLQELEHPQTLFAETPADRRDRLRYLLSMNPEFIIEEEEEDNFNGVGDDEEFLTEGSLELLESRKDIGKYSLPRAEARLKKQNLESSMPVAHTNALRQDLFKYLRTYINVGSQVGDKRPLTQTKFAPNSNLLATSSWSGAVDLWSVPQCQPIRSFKGHSDRVGGLAFHPQATLSQSESSLNLASGGADQLVRLWSLDSDEPLATLEGHQGHISRIGFHPSGQYLGTTSFDYSWRLWDLETQQELLLQEGHYKEVYCISFQCDGSLVVTGGMGNVGRVWDLRTGQVVMDLKGHIDDLLSLDFAPNGHQLASSSKDNTVKVWDLRTLRSIYTLPAHKSAVSEVKYYSGEVIQSRQFQDPDTDLQSEIKVSCDGLYLCTTAFDGLLKFWSNDDFKPVHSIQAHEGKVMAMDVAKDNTKVVTGGFDRTFKLWACDESNTTHA